MFVTDLQKINEVGNTSHRQNNNFTANYGFNSKFERPSSANMTRDGYKTAYYNKRQQHLLSGPLSGQKNTESTLATDNFKSQIRKQSNQSQRYDPLKSQTMQISQTKSQTNSQIHQKNKSINDNQQLEVVWQAVGQYINKQLIQGKGVWIPKLGNFTFTGINVDMSGSTNPNERDRQERFPVFLIGKDFGNGTNLRTGIANGMTSEVYADLGDKAAGGNGIGEHYGKKIRPFAQHGVNGIIPKIKANYFEISVLTGGIASKDEVRNEVEFTIAKLANQVRQGLTVDFHIPQVGNLKISHGVAGVVFEGRLIEQCRGQTAKIYERSFVLGNNWMNNRIFEPNKTNYGDHAYDKTTISAFASPQQKQSVKLSVGGQQWLKNNLDIDMNSQNYPQTAKSTTSNKIDFSKRLMSPQQNNSLFGNRNETQTQAGIKAKDVKDMLRKLNTMSSNEARLLANDDLKSLTQQSHQKNSSIEDKAMALLQKASKSRTQQRAYQVATYSSIENKDDQELREIFEAEATANSSIHEGFRTRAMSEVSKIPSSFVSRVPELAPFQLMNLANDIFSVRNQIVEVVNSKTSQKIGGAISLRDVITSSKLLRVLVAAGYKTQIGLLKALLKEFGFQYNGNSCSVQQFLQKLRSYVNPEKALSYMDDADEILSNKKIQVSFQSAQKDERVIYNLTDDDELILGVKKRLGSYSTTQIIQELFYSVQHPMYQIFREQGDGQTMSLEQFIKIVKAYSRNVLEERDIIDSFKAVAMKCGRSNGLITFTDFLQNYGINVPTRGSLAAETEIIRKIREWMFTRQYSSEVAFERLLRSANRLIQKTLRRTDLHVSCIQNDVRLSAPEIDFLFDIISKKSHSKEIKSEQWLEVIYDDAMNPLQLIRELILSEGLDADDVLFQMKLKYWDEPLDLNHFSTSIRRIDRSFSDGQVKSLFNKLKNQVEVIEVTQLVENLCGSLYDTVDYKNKMYKQFYADIYGQNKDGEFIKLLEVEDLKADGRIRPDNLERVLHRITDNHYTELEVRKFVRQLYKDQDQKISYVRLLEKMQGLGNKNHNPFKNLVQRLNFFITSNKLTVEGLLRRLEERDTHGAELVPLDKFARFMSQKIDKKRTMDDLITFCSKIDVDKDGCIGEADLTTCLSNIHGRTFFENGGAALTSPQFNNITKFFPKGKAHEIPGTKVIDVVKQIRQSMTDKKLSFGTVFKGCDVHQVGMVNLGQFIKGIHALVTNISPFLLEKIFDIMDENKIGMVDQEKFLRVLQAEAPSQITQLVQGKPEDSFEWQEEIIMMVRQWVKNQKITSLEGFRSFDQDFDGLISKDDMRKSLIKFLRVRPEHILNTHLDRLFRIFSFYKTEHIQPSDFQRLIDDVNPFLTSATGNSDQTFKSSMGGGYVQTSTYDWKIAAIQQIGLYISHKYDSIEESFYDCSGNTEKVTYRKFVNFIVKLDSLRGFNLTESLYQKLYAEIDPHKKTYLSMKDWISAFQTFNQRDQLMVELKNFLQVQFANSASAFAFFQSIGTTPDIDFPTFSKAVRSLLVTRTLQESHILDLFKRISKTNQSDIQNMKFTKAQFLDEFSNIDFKGKQVINMPHGAYQRKGNSVTGDRMPHSIPSVERRGNVVQSKWETDIIEKLKRLIKASGKSIDSIFGQFDVDGSGDITAIEFRKAMKLISLGLTDMEIDRIMARTDANNDGIISYQEFAAKFRDDPDFDKRMKQRANDRLAEVKEKMILYMTSATDAFRLFDSSKQGRMTYLDWDQLIRKLSELSKEQVPCYSVIKDMFDTIDTALDQIIDINEWNAAFGGILSTGPKVSVKPTVLTFWENSLEATKIGQCLSRSRKLLIESFKKQSSHSDHLGESKYVTFKQAKEALGQILQDYFGKAAKNITDDKLACILRVGQVVTKIGSNPDLAIYDFMKVLDVYRDRYSAPQFE